MNGTPNKNMDDLKRAYHSGHSKARIFAFAVIGGLALEIVNAIMFSTGKSACEIALTVACDLLIMGGIYGEIFFGNKSQEAGDELQRISDERVAEANKIAAQAQLELEKLKTPRSLSPEQKSNIADKMTAFVNHRVVLGAFPLTAETSSFMPIIFDALKIAGTDVFINQAGISSMIEGSPKPTLVPKNFTKGVMIYFTPGNQKGQSFAEIFAGALLAEGVAAVPIPKFNEEYLEQRRKEGLDENAPIHEPVGVVIGEKP